MIGTIVFAGGIAFMFPALMALAVSRVDPSERGSVVGTTSAFVDLSFGLAPAILGLVVDGFGFEAAFLLSAVIAGLGALLLVSRRHTIAAPVGHAAT
jgi:predicted MFS family arabinose efflux permease